MGVKKTSLAKAVAAFFEENPTKAVVHSTTDGFLFEVKKFAVDHAKTLEDNEVEKHNNPNVEAEAEEATDQDTNNPAE